MPKLRHKVTCKKIFLNNTFKNTTHNTIKTEQNSQFKCTYSECVSKQDSLVDFSKSNQRKGNSGPGLGVAKVRSQQGKGPH